MRVFADALVIGAAEALQIRLQPMGSTILDLFFSIGKKNNLAAVGVAYERDKR